jgi:antirestriction protein ArdC
MAQCGMPKLTGVPDAIISLCRQQQNIMQNFDIYEMVTKLITDRLEAGVVPWHMPWKTAGAMPRNMVSKKVYRGFNFWYLLSMGFERPFFLTFNQVQELGATIRKGSKSFQVVFWKMVESREDPTKKVPYLRYYRVFHVDDVEGIDPKKLPSYDQHDQNFDPIGTCDRLVEEWKDCPTIQQNAEYACYVPSIDTVKIPNPRRFFKAEQYYSTLYHELCHATGNARRLNRHSKFPNHNFASADYSQEELTAEMGAAYLCGICGIENETIDNSAAYIQNWLQKLKNDKKFVLQAASYAQLATDYILGITPYETSETVVQSDENNPVVETFEF